jgi:hypothetical protein
MTFEQRIEHKFLFLFSSCSRHAFKTFASFFSKERSQQNVSFLSNASHWLCRSTDSHMCFLFDSTQDVIGNVADNETKVDVENDQKVSSSVTTSITKSSLLTSEIIFCQIHWAALYLNHRR